MNEIKLTAHILNRVFLLSLLGPEAYETDKKKHKFDKGGQTTRYQKLKGNNQGILIKLN